MIIRKIKMVHFRGFREKTIHFDAKPVVLLTAANGFGKTTTVDAIEWCLTGSIGRLKAAFTTRSTNENDRTMNAAGILKHREATDEDWVRVELTLLDEGRETVFCRVQQPDRLDPEASTVTIDGNQDEAQRFLEEHVGDRTQLGNFYHYHFCDIQKSFHVQSTKRANLKEIFREFITNYDNEKQIVKNLGIFAEDVKRYISDNDHLMLLCQKDIDTLEADQARVRKTSVQLPYPPVPFYPGEKTQIAGLTEKELLAQKKALQGCGHQAALEGLEKVAANESLLLQQSIAREIVLFWQNMGEQIRHATACGFPKNIDAIKTREQKLRKLEGLSLAKSTILSDSEALIALENPDFTRADLEADRTAIAEREEAVKHLASEIDLLTKNNKMLKILSSLNEKRQDLIEYRNAAAEHGAVRCPVCGSAAFADLEEEAIGLEAREYIRLNNEAVNAKTDEKTAFKSQIQGLYQKLIQRARKVVAQEQQKLNKEIRDLNALKNAVQPYFDTVEKLQNAGRKISAGELTAENAAQLLADIEAALLTEEDVLRLRERAHQILTVVGYRYENETVKQTCQKLRKQPSRPGALMNFSYDLLVSKLNSIDSMLDNQRLMELTKKLETCYAKKQHLVAENERLGALRDAATRRATAIDATVEQLTNDEYQKVGPALTKFYNKLARVNIGDIKLVQEKSGISLVDQEGKNIVNTFSNGQISVFMLAHFFAGINVRNSQEKLKIYFIDDLTACMDDVNMLAFLDLLKYQMSAKSEDQTMEQLFFITCDERISRLLKYKLEGRGIEYRELRDDDFAPTNAMMA